LPDNPFIVLEMHFTKPAVFGLIQSATVFAANQIVMVGPGGGLTFSPTTVKAAAGDTVQFMFATQVRAAYEPRSSP
jgi:plastocyanin